MTQAVLIAVDDSENALRAVAYVARNFTPDQHVTLFNVLVDSAAICKMESPELTPLFKSQQTHFCALEDKKRELVSAALEKGEKILLDAGFRQDHIHLKQEPKKAGVARDILAEAGEGYDLVVVGRRGLSGVKEFFLGSTSQKIFNGARDVSVLIVN